MIFERSLFRQYGQVERFELPPQLAASADQVTLSGRRDHCEVRLTAAQRAVRVRPERELRTLLQDLRASREERSHREREHLVDHIGSPSRLGKRVRALGHRRPQAAARDRASKPVSATVEQPHVAAERLHLPIVAFFERTEAAKHIGGLSHHQAKIAKVERDVFESEERCALSA